MIADISPLVGRHFIAKSDNRGRVERIEFGAARMVWARKPSDEDIAEFTAWVSGILGNVEVTLCLDGRKKEAEALASWKRKGDA